MRKLDLANLLGVRFGLTRLLEISTPTTGASFATADPAVFTRRDRLVCGNDPRFTDDAEITFRTTPEEAETLLATLEAAGLRYDLVFVDPFHSYAASARDLGFARRLLAPGGMLLVHDTDPPDEAATADAFRPGAWHGRTWEAMLDLLARDPALSHVSVQEDHGITAIAPGDRLAAIGPPGPSAALWADWLATPAADRFAFFQAHRATLLRLVTADRLRAALRLPPPPPRPRAAPPPAARPAPPAATAMRRPMQDRLRAGLRRIGRHAAVLAGGAAGALDRRDQVLERIDGTVPLGPRVAVAAHHDPLGRLSAPFRHYLEAVAAQGYTLILASNAPGLDAGSRGWARDHTALTLLRRNRGFDFAAWRDAMHAAGLPGPGTEALLLLNDSVYGPFGALDPLFARFDFAAADVWGATESWQHCYHLQSYLLAFGPRALASPAFAAFWAAVRPAWSREYVVRHHEIGLTRALLHAGLRCAAAFPYEALSAAALDGRAPATTLPPALATLAEAATRQALARALDQAPMNPASELWRPLMEAGFPLLKREILARNPQSAPDIAAWRLVAGTRCETTTRLVIEDLRLRLRWRTP